MSVDLDFDENNDEPTYDDNEGQDFEGGEAESPKKRNPLRTVLLILVVLVLLCAFCWLVSRFVPLPFLGGGGEPPVQPQPAPAQETQVPPMTTEQPAVGSAAVTGEAQAPAPADANQAPAGEANQAQTQGGGQIQEVTEVTATAVISGGEIAPTTEPGAAPTTDTGIIIQTPAPDGGEVATPVPGGEATPVPGEVAPITPTDTITPPVIISPTAPVTPTDTITAPATPETPPPPPPADGNEDQDNGDQGYAMPPINPALGTAGYCYQVQPGDTLWGVATAYGVELPDLAFVNGVSPRYHVIAGQGLFIPTGPINPHGPNVYMAQPGDTLSSIAYVCGTTVEDLQFANGMPPQAEVMPGQIVRIPPPWSY